MLNNNTKRRLSIFYKAITKINTCWLWNNKLHRTGYGYYNKELVHRFAYKLWIGDIPDNLFVLHKCDIRNCINPAHL